MTNTTIGEQLRKARLAQSLDLSQIAQETKIGKYYLEAIEANQIERLPGLFFYKAFVRQYSKQLNLDSKKLEAQINAEQGAPEVTITELSKTRGPIALREPALRAANKLGGDLRLVFAAVALIAVLIGGSVVYTWTKRPAPVVLTEDKPIYVPPEEKRAQTPAAQPQRPEPSESSQAELRKATNLTPEAGPDSSVSLSLSAIEPTWITISSDGKNVYTGVLEPSQSKLLSGKSKVMIKVGNAAGLEVRWNGKQIGRLGDQKQVRTILFTEKEYQIMKPPPAPGSADPVS